MKNCLIYIYFTGIFTGIRKKEKIMHIINLENVITLWKIHIAIAEVRKKQKVCNRTTITKIMIISLDK